MATPLWIQVINSYRRALDDLSQEAAGEMLNAWERAGNNVLSDMEGLAKFLERLDDRDRVNVSALRRMERYQRLLVQIDAEMRELSQAFGPILDRQSRQFAVLGQQFAVDVVNALTGLPVVGPGSIRFTMDLLNSDAVENIVSLARADKPLGQILRRHGLGVVEKVTDALINGAVKGDNPRDTARRMMQSGFGASSQQALLIARDQQVRNFREAGRQNYQDNGITRYQRMAAHQTRTCLACLSLDGRIYETAELFPAHPQCRCTMVPIVPGFRVPERKFGKEYFERLSPTTQREMMGPGRYDAWRSGKFEFEDLARSRDNPVWGPGVGVTPLKDLLRGRGGIPHVTPPSAFTTDYQRARVEVAQIQRDGELFPGELQDAYDRLAFEQEASEWARRNGFDPASMSQAEWSGLADRLRDEALDDLRLATAGDREAAGNRAVGRRRVEGGDFIQVGGQAVQRKWVGGSAKRARAEVNRINRETERAATEFMVENLVRLGYQRSNVQGLNYNQLRRLMAEIGNGTLQKQNIGKVPKAERQRVVLGTSERDRRVSLDIAYNPRAGAGMEKWGGYEVAMVKAGKEDEIEMPPNAREEVAPEFVTPQSGFEFEF